MKPDQPVRWMRCHAGWLIGGDTAQRRLFHVFDARDVAACDPHFGLIDGDRPARADLGDLCPDCLLVVCPGLQETVQ